MQVESSEQIRNITLAGHADTGKTTLASAALFTAGVANRLQKVEDGGTITDFDSEEIARGHSIGLAPCFVPWRRHKINIVDAPGSGIFGVESRAAVRATDALVLVVSAASGVEVTTERMWRFAGRIEQPVLIHVNKLDRENTDFTALVERLDAKLGHAVTPLQIPIGAESEFTGVVDLVERKAYSFERDGNGAARTIDLPQDLEDSVDSWRERLIEAVAESDDELMELYFEEGTLPDDALERGLRQAIARRTLFPLTVGSALHGIGTARFLDAVVDHLPNPLDRGTFPATDVGGQEIELATATDGPFAALVFKTLNDPFTGKLSLFRVVSGTLKGDTPVLNTRAEEREKVGQPMAVQGKTGTAVERLVTGDIGALAKLKHTLSGDTLCDPARTVKLGWVVVRPPAMSFAVEPKTQGDEEKMSDSLQRLMEEDLGLSAGRDPQTNEMLLSGTGQRHVEVAVNRLKTRYKVDVVLHPPTVPYRETIRRAADGHGRHKKQSGGRGQFADCKIRIEPIEEGQEFEFKDEIFGGAIPQGFRPAVEKGIQEARLRGFLAGYPVVDFRVRLLDGQYHDVDSSEMAFKVAG
ncbi:MAG: elongation factor G, partial [Acidobacteriota bacterium]